MARRTASETPILPHGVAGGRGEESRAGEFRRDPDRIEKVG
jgi:hypothetical protein